MVRRRFTVVDAVVEIQAPTALEGLVGALYADAVSSTALPTLTVAISTVTAEHRMWHQVSIDSQDKGQAADVGELYELLQRELTYTLLAKLSSRYLLLHAGGVGVGDAVWLLPGYHDSGKSSLVLALARGGTCFADDVIGVDPGTLIVSPFARDLVLHHGTRKAAAALPAPPAFARFAAYDYLPASAAGLSWATPAPVTGLVFPRRGSSQRPRLVRVSPSEAARRLLEQCFDLQGLGAVSIDVIARLAQRPAIDVHFDDAQEAILPLLAWSRGDRSVIEG